VTSGNNPELAEVVERFHRAYYDQPETTWGNTWWLGARVAKCPLDLWVVQEVVFETKPDLIIECGTGAGGSAYFLACVCDHIGSGRIITIDIVEEPRQGPRPLHPRITYVSGSTVAPEVVTQVREAVGGGERVMVILDSDHSKDHVLAELREYAPLVSVGSYLIVEDTNINGHPVLPAFGPGPHEALQEFLWENDCFSVDRSREKHMMCMHPGGFLKRVK
jgi:cephalosporin hydroxylase